MQCNKYFVRHIAFQDNHQDESSFGFYKMRKLCKLAEEFSRGRLVEKDFTDLSCTRYRSLLKKYRLHYFTFKKKLVYLDSNDAVLEPR